MKISGRFSDSGLLILRIVPTVLLVVFHGWSKLISASQYIFQGQEWRFIAGVANLGFPIPSFFAICSALAESLMCGLLAVGLFSRYAAAILIINFSVAVYRHMIADWRIEMAALYWTIFIVIAVIGPGRYSLDARWKGRNVDADGAP